MGRMMPSRQSRWYTGISGRARRDVFLLPHATCVVVRPEDMPNSAEITSCVKTVGNFEFVDGGQ